MEDLLRYPYIRADIRNVPEEFVESYLVAKVVEVHVSTFSSQHGAIIVRCADYKTMFAMHRKLYPLSDPRIAGITHITQYYSSFHEYLLIINFSKEAI